MRASCLLTEKEAEHWVGECGLRVEYSNLTHSCSHQVFPTTKLVAVIGATSHALIHCAMGHSRHVTCKLVRCLCAPARLFADVQGAISKELTEQCTKLGIGA